jgi:KDO2-lipid IV(A) lauroyltransferase
MGFIGFLFTLLFIYPLSLLPIPLLYLISDGLAFLLRVVFGYRKKVVEQNIRHSFPKKTEKEIQQIIKASYAHLSDIIIETIKTFTISKRQLKRRVSVKNPELISELYEEGKSIVAVSGHFNNWEWAGLAFDVISPHLAVGIYKKLSNKYFNNLMKWSRERHGIRMIEAKTVYDFFQHEQQKFIIGFLSDQWPSKAHAAYWTTFLNQETAVFLGAEKYAVKYNIPVVYGHIHKVKRGSYSIEYEVISLKPQEEVANSITEKHLRLLEKDIQATPGQWIWSHKRWKKTKAKALADAEPKKPANT